ncbi:uracil permease, partial [Casaltella massiliensis]|nr:uracil permease [Casaltella massiliensis]
VIIAAKEAHNGDLAYAQGGIIVAGIIYLIMAAVIKKVGVDKIKKYFPAQVVGAMIAVIGLNLLPTAVDMASNNFLIAI